MTASIYRGERRRHARGEIAATAAVLTADRYAGAFLVENLSAGGALLIGDAHLVVGAGVRLLLHLPDKKPISLAAEVVRVEVRGEREHRFAVAFRRVSPAVEDAIQTAILRTLERWRDAPQPRVLVVDDSRETCRALERDLRALGCWAAAAATAPEALMRLDAADTDIDTAFVELRLGLGVGLEVMALVGARHPEVRRVLMSASARECQLSLAVASGTAHAVLEKPWCRASLAKVLARCHGKGE